MLRWLGFVMGYVTVSVKGGFTERFINLCGFHRMDMWDYTSDPDGITVKVRISDYKKLRNIARKTGVRLHISSKHGIPFLIHRYRHRYGIVAGALVFVLLLNLLCNRIWTLELHGVQPEDETRVRKILAEFGVKEGMGSSAYHWATLRQDVIAKYPEISWMSLNPEGTTLRVDVSKRVEPPTLPDSSQPCNVMAAKDGTIVDLQVHSGQSMVQVGEGVVKGDLLISGAVEYKDGSTYFRHASGKVIAQTMQTVTFEIPYEQTHSLASGEQTTRYVLRLFGFSVPLYIGSIQRDYVKTTESKPLVIGGVTLPFSLETGRFSFTVPHTVILTEDEAMAEAVEKVDEYIAKNLSQATIESVDYENISSKNALKVTAKITCKENIGIEEKMLIF